MNDKDKSAIDHVASVSKHPHAAMIVKWIITGWDVEHEYVAGEWRITGSPSWSPGSKYRLIEPKPAKPAYRVYIDPINGNPAIVRRSTYDIDYKSYDGKVEWLTEWKEYDQPKKWPTPLVERIAAINLEAAQWIVDHWDDLLEERYSGSVSGGRESHKLRSMFQWSESPQGKEYWYAISKQLGE